MCVSVSVRVCVYVSDPTESSVTLWQVSRVSMCVCEYVCVYACVCVYVYVSVCVCVCIVVIKDNN